MRQTMVETAARAMRVWQHGAQRNSVQPERRQACLCMCMCMCMCMCHALLIE